MDKQKLIAFFEKCSQAFLDKPEHAAKEFELLFEGMEQPGLRLWESTYISAETRLYNEVTAAVKAAYRKAGLCVKDSLRQPPDHIGIECAFFALLLRKNEQILAADFFWNHLKPFAEQFAVELEKRVKSDFYQELAEQLLDVISAVDMDKLMFGPKKDAESPIFSEGGMQEPGEEIIRSCGVNNCGARCPIRIRMKDGCVLGILTDDAPDKEELPQIRACARGLSYHHTFMSPERLRYPMKRIGERGEGKFKRITWEQAITEIARQWQRITEQYGPASRYVNYASGINAVADGKVFARHLMALDGGYLNYYNSYSSACARIAAPYTFGTTLTGNSSSQLVHSKLIILWGHNPAESQFGSLTTYYIKKAKELGTKIIAVDPRCSDTAKGLADRWISLKPGTDCALMAGMAYVILTENLQEQRFMDKFCLGFDNNKMPEGYDDQESFIDYIYGRKDGVVKTPAWAAGITGAAKEDIVMLARDYARTKPAALLQGLGPQRHSNGEQVIRFAAALAAMTGNIGIAGGEAGGCGSKYGHAEPNIAKARNPLNIQIPTFLWTDAIIRGKEMTAAADGVRGAAKLDADIKMIFNLAGNILINQHGNINRTVDILKDTTKCEFIVCSDVFMTPSAKFADILLPGTSMFEGSNICPPLEDGDYLLSSNKVMEPIFECRFEYDWLRELAEKLGIGELFSFGGKTYEEVLEMTYNENRIHEPELPDYAEFKKMGGYRYESNPHPVAFSEQIEDFHNHPFPTDSGKIEIFSPRLYEMNNPEEIPAIPKYVPGFEGSEDELTKRYPLQLTGWHTKRRCHSVHDNNPWMEALEKPALWMHPLNARDRGIKDGDLVEVFNDRGKVRISAKLTRGIAEGVTAMSQGAWYTPDQQGTDIRGSLNTLTTHRPTALAKGNPQHSNLVEVKRVESEV